jgi:PAS domain S-box-containing protein
MVPEGYDITEHKKAEKVIQESERKFRSIYESARDAIVLTDGNRFVDCNVAALKMFGYNSKEEFCQRRPSEVSPAIQPDGCSSLQKSNEILAAAIQGQSELFEWMHQQKDGRDFPTEILLSPMKWEGVDVVQAVIRDISERKRAEDELLRLNVELEQRVKDRTNELAQANKDLESFSYSVSHDLRAPLRHISGFVNLLGRYPALKEEGKHRHYMEMILDSSQQMGQLIDDLLVFSRMGRAELNKERVNINELIDDIVRSRKLEIEGRTINWQIAELPTVSGDRSLLRVVMDNLISNALKYTRREGEARIEIGTSTGENNRTVIFIHDNGVGFNMDYAHKLFGVFHRLHSDEEFEGTGIGLATVERIIHRHGGTIRGESKEGQGATFYVII